MSDSEYAPFSGTITPTRTKESHGVNDMMPLSEVAADLGITHATLARQARLGRLKGARKVGPIWLVPRSGVDMYRTVSLGRPGRKKSVRQ